MSDTPGILHASERTRIDNAIRADMANDPKLHEAAVARSVDLARDAGRHEGTPDAAWSLGEKLLTALVFQGPEQLKALGYSEAEAQDRVRFDYGASSAEFPQVLARIRSEL
jgi:hypothetical protein